MNTRTLGSIVVFAVCMISQAASAINLVNLGSTAQSNKLATRTMLADMRSTYKMNDGSGKFRVHSQSLGEEITKNIGENVDIISQIALTTKTIGTTKQGLGFTLGGGARYKVIDQGNIQLLSHCLLSYSRDEVEDIDNLELITKETNSLIELHTGATVRYQISSLAALYSGLEVLPISQGKSKGGREEDSLNTRDGFSVIRVGAIYEIRDLELRSEIATISEKTLTVGGSYNF